MGMIDSQLIFSDAQDLTATAVSSNVVDMGVALDLGAGEPLWVLFVFGTVVSNATWYCAFKGADNAAISTNPITKFTTPTLTPVSNSFYAFRVPPGIPKQFYRCDYTMSGGTSPHIPTTATLVKDAEVKIHSRGLLSV
jgi:hypothetical protein